MPLLQRIDKLTELSDVAGRTLDCRAAVTHGRWLRTYGDRVIELSVMQATWVNAYARRYYRTSDGGYRMTVDDRLQATRSNRLPTGRD